MILRSRVEFLSFSYFIFPFYIFRSSTIPDLCRCFILCCNCLYVRRYVVVTDINPSKIKPKRD